MMTSKLEKKLNTLMDNWTNGNISDAQQQIRNLNKSELAQLLINQQLLSSGVMSRSRVIALEDFIVDAL
jgi:hypothetical protein